MIQTPYLLFLADVPDPLAAKVAQGIKDWRPKASIGQLRLPECKADMELPDITIKQAKEMGAKTLVIGVANRGGIIADNWKDVIKQAIEEKMDVASGLHNLLTDEAELVELAQKNGCKLHDVRVPDREYPIANGEKRKGKRCLAVGTDCSVGKMYTAMAMEKEMKKRNMKATFRATGQTGILITGDGVPLDAVIADFMAGAIEWLTPDNDPDHWDIIEGQGSLYHASFSGVTMALIHGGQPDALILCHEPTRKHMRGLPHYQQPSLEELRDAAMMFAKVVNPDVKVTGIAINTFSMDEDEAKKICEETEKRMKLPTVDPIRHGAERLVENLE